MRVKLDFGLVISNILVVVKRCIRYFLCRGAKCTDKPKLSKDVNGDSNRTDARLKAGVRITTETGASIVSEHMKNHVVRLKKIATLCLLSLIFGCSVAKQSDAGAVEQDKDQLSDSATPTLQKICSEPRPGVCTMIYAPVCGFDADGGSKEYASGCVACSDIKVIGHNQGRCNSVPESKLHLDQGV